MAKKKNTLTIIVVLGLAVMTIFTLSPFLLSPQTPENNTRERPEHGQVQLTQEELEELEQLLIELEASEGEPRLEEREEQGLEDDEDNLEEEEELQTTQ